jgi:outer membrane protein
MIVKTGTLKPEIISWNRQQTKIRVTFTLLLAFILFAFTGRSQTEKKWTLEECINYALEHNINIKKQLLNVEYQNEALLQSKLGMLPNINGYASHGYNWGQRIDPFTNEFASNRVRSNNFNLSADLNLFAGLQQTNTIKRNLLNKEAAQYDAEAYKDEISISVATAYLQVLYNKEFVQIAKDQLDISNQQVDRTKKLVDAGTLAKGDLLTIQAQAASEQLSVVNAENNLSLALLTLTQLLELPSTEGFDIDVPQLGLIEAPENVMSPENIYKTAVEVRPEIKGAETRVESSKRSLGIARGSYYPSLSLSGSWGSGYSGANTVGTDPFTQQIEIGYTENTHETVIAEKIAYQSYNTKAFGDQLRENRNESVSLSLRIPIFNGWRSRSSVAQAKIGVENANLDLQLQKNTLYKTIQQAYNDAASALNKHKASLLKVEATKESFNYAEKKFNVGLINSVDYNNAKKEYNRALSEQIQAKYEFVFKMTVIDFYLGKPLTLTR